ncbi:MAG: LptF/LptG family permease, partial [Leptolyngbya sp.]|nr:LptF/LptG family permease [Leptolyngbya sp.]
TILRLQHDQELVVIQATGTSDWQLARPIMKAALWASIILTFMTSWLTPVSLASLQSERHAMNAQFSLSLLQDGVFNFFGNDLMVYFESRDDQGRLLHLILHDQRDKEKPYTLMAARGQLITDGNTYRLNVEDGRRQSLNPERQIVDQLTFSRYEIELPKTVGAMSQRWKEPDERTLFELIRPESITIYDINNADELNTEIHRRLAIPFLPFSFALPILLIVLKGYKPRRPVLYPIIKGLFVILLIQILVFLCTNIALNNQYLIPLIYVGGLGPAFLALTYLLPSHAAYTKKLELTR